MDKSQPSGRVLICDDNPQQYVRLKRYLSSEGFICDDRVSTYEQVAVRLRDAAKSLQWYQLVMLDIDLKYSKESMNGIQMYRSLAVDFPDENYIIYSRHDVDRFRQELNRFKFNDAALVLLDEVLTKHHLRVNLARLSDASDRDTVFLVCGRHLEKNRQITSFLQKGLRLEVVSWEQAKRHAKSDYIWEIVLQGIRMSHATVVLFTDDEQVRLRSKFCKRGEEPADGRRQSRPNVFIEAGYARGIRQKRTVFVEWPDRTVNFTAPSDFQGIHALRFRDDKQSRTVLADRLEAARCAVRRSPQWLSMAL